MERDTIQAKAESASKQQLKDNETAEDISDGEPQGDQETQYRQKWSFSKTSLRRAEPLIDFFVGESSG